MSERLQEVGDGGDVDGAAGGVTGGGGGVGEVGLAAAVGAAEDEPALGVEGVGLAVGLDLGEVGAALGVGAGRVPDPDTPRFLDAARVVGARDGRTILRHILPNASSPIIVAASLSVGNVILSETAPSFLGMGVQLPQPSWGNMLTNAQQYLYRAPRLIVIPGSFIFVSVLAANLVGNGLRDALDPKAGE